MIASEKFHYGRTREAGEEFDAENEGDALILEHAEKAKRRPAGSGQGYATRQMLAQEVNAPQLGELKRKVRYARRDLKAKD